VDLRGRSADVADVPPVARTSHLLPKKPAAKGNGCCPRWAFRQMQPVKHGRASTYESGKCRCEQCRAAAMDARRRQRERRRQKVAAGDTSRVVHGTWAAYVTDGCRCEECRRFKSDYMKKYRARRQPA
jgi:hypothetical protein